MIPATSSNGSNCIDVDNPRDDLITITETDFKDLSVLTNQENFTHFVAAAKAGQYDMYCDAELLELLEKKTEREMNDPIQNVMENI